MFSTRLAIATISLLVACPAAVVRADNQSDYVEIVGQAVLVLNRRDGPITTFIAPADADPDLVAALKTAGKVEPRSAVPKSDTYTLPNGYFIVEEVNHDLGVGEVIGVAGPGALEGTMGNESDCGTHYSISFSLVDSKWQNGSYKIEKCVPASVIEASASKLKDTALSGDAEAQFRLGLDYKYGDDGVAKNEVLALTWIRRAAEQGIAEAQVTLAFALAEGHGIAKDDA
ncbi:MAG: hypothetical protein ABIR27_08880 [Dokdonella sp.]